VLYANKLPIEELFSLNTAHFWSAVEYQTPTGACGTTRHGQGEIPPGVRFGVMNSRSLRWPLVAPLLMNVESPLILALVGTQTKCEVTVTVAAPADAMLA
jgi:hypothetical protein